MPKQGRRRIVINGKKVLCKGDAARGSLHNDTYYGAIKQGDEIKYVVRKPLDQLKESDIKNIVDDTVKGIIQQAISEKGFKEAMTGPIWMNEEKQIPINKVRLFATTVTNPLKIRQQRDVSTKEYKRQFNVANDRNYLMAIYIGKDEKGKEKRDFKLISNLQAARFYRTSNEKESAGNSVIPLKSSRGYPLAYTLKIGTMVLLYENSPEEIWEGDIRNINNRLYKVVGMSLLRTNKRIYGRIVLNFHEEARKSSDFKPKNGEYTQNEEFRSSILMLHTQLNALIEGQDFRITETGEIQRLK